MTQSLGAYTFATVNGKNELRTGICERVGDVPETKEALAQSVTQWNGTKARTWTLTGNLYTNGGTTYLDKMSSLIAVQDSGKVAYVDTVRVPDASNSVNVYVTKLRFEDPFGGTEAFVPFSLTLKEALD